jgi:hypothetical protein
MKPLAIDTASLGLEGHHSEKGIYPENDDVQALILALNKSLERPLRN